MRDGDWPLPGGRVNKIDARGCRKAAAQHVGGNIDVSARRLASATRRAFACLGSPSGPTNQSDRKSAQGVDWGMQIAAVVAGGPLQATSKLGAFIGEAAEDDSTLNGRVSGLWMTAKRAFPALRSRKPPTVRLERGAHAECHENHALSPRTRPSLVLLRQRRSL